MVPSSGRGKGDKGREHRPHHISSIAHHFFDEEGDPDLGRRFHRLDLAVAGAGPGGVVARVCAGLTRSLPEEEIILGESVAVKWSATSYLAADCLNPCDHPDVVRADHRFWHYRPSPPPTGSGERVGSRRPSSAQGVLPVLLRNLGTFSRPFLSQLESLADSFQPADIALPGADGLVWVLSEQRSMSLAAAHDLGRILRLMRPRCLEVCLVEGNQPLTSETTSRCRQLIAAVNGSRPLGFSHLGPPSENQDGHPPPALQAMGQRLIRSDYSD